MPEKPRGDTFTAKQAFTTKNSMRMIFQRALMLAPLALLVAVTAHVVGFAADHAFGGPYAAQILVGALGGSALLALAGLLWAGIDGNATRSAAALWATLWGRDAGGMTAVLAMAGFVAFASGEIAEGRSPLGTWTTALALVLTAAAVAWAARRIVRWLAAGGALLHALLLTAKAPFEATQASPSREISVFPSGAAAGGICRGRAPPLFA